ncbi:amidase [Tistrella bauzanensis]|uniref:amidase n=1 Tax=Tistrella TaxID=171436 RepID=UPI0031F6F629
MTHPAGSSTPPIDLCTADVATLAAAYAARALSPVEVAQACLDRARAVQPTLNPCAFIDDETTLAAARQSEARWMRQAALGPLDGVPATIKDLLLSAGWPTLRGSRAIDPDQPWDEDSPPVARLREAGAVFIAKTTTPEFGHKGVTESPLAGITRNPWYPEVTPGGSSGGAAVAAAAGIAALNLGTDGGGSIRIPASFTGIFGLKPSFGRVPSWPPSPFARLAHVGPMTRTVTDAALMLNAIARPDWRDWYAQPYPAQDFATHLNAGLKGLRIGYAPTINDEPVDEDVAAAVAAAVAVFRAEGAVIEQIDLALPDARRMFQILWTTGAAVMAAGMSEDQRRHFDRSLGAAIAIGQGFSAIDLGTAEFKRAALARVMAELHQRYDLILTPSLPVTAFTTGQNQPGQAGSTEWNDWTPFSYPFNLTGQPAASIPCGFDRDGLPVGLQIVGPVGADALVLRAARGYERVCPIALPPLDI